METGNGRYADNNCARKTDVVWYKEKNTCQCELPDNFVNFPKLGANLKRSVNKTKELSYLGAVSVKVKNKERK